MDLFLLFFYLLGLAIFAYRMIKISGTRPWLIFSVILILSVLLFYHEHANEAILLTSFITFNAIISTYSRRECYLFIAIAVLCIFVEYPLGASLILQSAFLGMLSGSNLEIPKVNPMHKGNETWRNLIQIAGGIFFICLFLFLPIGAAAIITITIVLAGSALGNHSIRGKESGLVRTIHSFERPGAILGSGARWLAMGTLVAASFLTGNYVIAVFSAIFIADSFSTLVGINLKTPRLPYNKKKSIGGTFAYFISVLLISYFFIGPISFAVALLAAFAESQPLHLDDNFDVAVVMVAFFIIAAHLGLIAL